MLKFVWLVAHAADMTDVVQKAYVTLVTSNEYAIGALVLAHSLRRLHTKYHIVCIITESVSMEKRYGLLGIALTLK